MLIKAGDNIIKSDSNILDYDENFVFEMISMSGYGYANRVYINVISATTITIEWGDGNKNSYSVSPTTILTMNTYYHSYPVGSELYKVRILVNNFDNINGLGVMGVYKVANFYKKLKNLKTIRIINLIYIPKKTEFYSFYDNPNLINIDIVMSNSYLDYDSVPDNIEYFRFEGYVYNENIQQTANVTYSFLNKKKLNTFNLTYQPKITMNLGILSGNTSLTNITSYGANMKLYGDISFLKYTQPQTINIYGTLIYFNFKGTTFTNKITLLYVNEYCEWNMSECIDSFNLTYTNNNLYAYSNMKLSGATSDLASVRSDLSTLKFVLFKIQSTDLYGDFSYFNRIATTFRFQVEGSNMFGDIETFNQPHIKPSSIFSVAYCKVYGDCTFLSGITAASIFMYYIQNYNSQFLTNLEYIVKQPNRTTLSFYASSFTNTDLDVIINAIFEYRANYNNSISKSLQIQYCSGKTSGTYQQPDLGTFTGNINNLTETQIDNLVAGLDYTGSGTNIAWTVREKMWILVNLDVSSTNANARYSWTITYTT
jgi:hypothetical protein